MIIKFAIKSGVAITAVYFTKHQNVWSDSVATSKLYDNLCGTVQPHVKKLKNQIPIEMPLLPTSGEICYITKYYYNCGVKKTIHFIHMFPCYMGRWAKKGKDAITQALDATETKQELSLPATTVLESKTTTATNSKK